MDSDQLSVNIKIIHKVINDLVYIPTHVEREDLEQIAKIALWEAISSFDETKGVCLTTYSYQCIRNTLLNYLKYERREKRRKVTIKPPKCLSVEDQVINSMLVKNLIKTLSENELPLFTDRYIQRLTLKELAEKYQISIKQTRTRLGAIKKKILQELLEWGDK